MTSTLSHAVPQLAFAVERAEAMRFAATPTLAFGVRVESDRPVRSLALNVQVRIMPARRTYDAADERRLFGLFGPAERWGDALQSFRWATATVLVPGFERVTVAELPVACTYDLDVAASRYFDGLRDGEAPLELLFSGTVFFLGDDGLLRAARVPWECEAQFRLPVSLWKEAIELCFPGSSWLRLDRRTFDRLAAYRMRRALPTWEAAIDELLEERP